MKTEDKKITDGEILKKITEALKISEYRLSKELGYKSPASFYNIQAGTTKITKNMINSMLLKYPEINPEFLYTGEGEVLRYKNIADSYRESNPNFDKTPMETMAMLFALPEKISKIEQQQYQIAEKISKILNILEDNTKKI